MTENSRQIMADNIKKYMDRNHVLAADVCKACGFKQNTFSDWVNAKTYPRIDKIEKMAAYFHCSVADLMGTEEDPIDIAVKVNSSAFQIQQAKRIAAYTKMLNQLSEKQLDALGVFLDALGERK